jgi:hypothetical protein
METYFKVLQQATAAVAARHGGYQAAVACEGFLTDFIPGIVMGAVFAQMSLLAQPLCLALGAENHGAREVEELVLAAPGGLELGAIDARLRGAREVAGGLYLARVPTFKPLTEVLLALALRCRSATLLLLSTHASVHVKVSAAAAEAGQLGALEGLRGRGGGGSAASAVPGVAHLYTFSLPHVGGGEGAPLPASQASFLVEAAALLPLLRYCHVHALGVQVYDFN